MVLRKEFSWKLLFASILFTMSSAGNIGYSQVKINEVLAINASINYDPQYFNFPAWIELYNTNATNINIGGYYLTDSRLNKTKWAIPANTIITANSYLMIWCDNENTGLHTNFDIDSDGEGIYFYNSILSYIDSIRIPKQYPNVSYGRLSNGATWGYLQTPTPAAINGSTGGLALLTAPVFSLPSGRYASGITLSITSSIAGAQIRITTDGSEPTPTLPVTSAPFPITQTTVVKAKVYTSYGIPSETVTRTYLINEHASILPVVSISMNPAFLNDNTIGMYVQGTNGIVGNCTSTPSNFNQDWGRYGVVELFNPTGTSEFKKDFEIKIYGACSRTFNAQKSLAFYARNEFGKGHLEYKLFPSKDIDKFDNFILRNSGNDCNVAHFRDGLMQEIISKQFDIDWMAYQPAVVYINGSYWGIMNIREKLNENYIEHNAKVDADSINYLEGLLRTGDGYILSGSNTDYLAFLNKLTNINLSTDAAFDYINSQIDVNEYINYLIAEIYYKNTDWPGNNSKFWKPVKQGGKWRWIIFDTDFGFNDATHQTLHYMTDSATTVDWPNPQWSTLLFRRLIKNPTFKNKFIQSFQTAINSTFKPARVNFFIDSISNLLASEMAYHKVKWGGTVADWNNQVNNLRYFAKARYSFMPGYIKSFFNLTQPSATVIVKSSSAVEGTIKINGIKTTGSDTLELLEQIPYNIEAIPGNGYKFKQWNIKEYNAVNTTLINRSDSWKYYDSGTNLGSVWPLPAYSDASWLSGNAQLGYGDGDETTIVSYGPNSSNKYITTYFRKTVNIIDTTNLKLAKLTLLADDGAVIYVNGIEAARFNMPVGIITYTTLASSASTENVYVEYSINPKLFKPGANVIAVEIHQNNVTSSDLSFDMDLKISKLALTSEYSSNNTAFSDTAKGIVIYNAQFEQKTPLSNIFINEIAAQNSTITDNYGNKDDWFELYNANSDSIDLNGLFLTDNFSKKAKFQIRNNGAVKTKIPPYGYTIFWADEEEHQGNNHTSFKLSGTGERLGLFQLIGTDTLAMDSITYFSQPLLSSQIRYPDGTGNWFLTSTITPNATNIKTATQIPQIGAFDNGLVIYPNPVSDYINIGTNHSLINASYMILNNMGQIMDNGRLNKRQIMCSNIKPGVYILIITNNNEKYYKGFIKK
jgi:hypothetical protein